MNVLCELFRRFKSNNRIEPHSSDIKIYVRSLCEKPDGETIIDFKVPSKKLYKLSINIDEFTRAKIIEFRQVASYNLNKLLTWGDSDDFVQLNFGFRNNNGQDIIMFSTYQKTVKLKKGDKIAFLFQDKEVKEFELVENGYRIDKDSEGVIIESYLPINKDIIEKFSNVIAEKWRLIPCDDRRQETGTLGAELQNDILEMTKIYKFVFENSL